MNYLCLHPCNHCPDQDVEHCSTQKPLCPPQVTTTTRGSAPPSAPRPAPHALDFLYWNGTQARWSESLLLKCSRGLCLVCAVVAPFLAINIVSVQIHLSLLVPCPTDRHLSCFNFGAVMSKAAVNLLSRARWWTQDHPGEESQPAAHARPSAKGRLTSRTQSSSST